MPFSERVLQDQTGTSKMVFVPYDRQVLISSLDPNAINSRLSQCVDTNMKWYQHSSEKEFRGKLSDAGFWLRRNIKGRNSYVPIVKGKFEFNPAGTKILLTYGMDPIVMLVLAAMLLTGEILALSGENSFSFTLLFFFLGFHCLMYVAGYLPEKRRAEQFLMGELAVPGPG